MNEQWKKMSEQRKQTSMNPTVKNRQQEDKERQSDFAHADCYRLLAACFYPPDKMMADEGVLETLKTLLETVYPDIGLQTPSFPSNENNEGLTSLAVAYTRLFLGPPGIPAPPYASYYLDKTGMVMGPSVVEISRIYQSAGLNVDDDFDEMPDHIAVMLEFLYVLLFMEARAALEKNHEEVIKFKNTRHRFLNDYMRPWIPGFCEKIGEADVHPFYNDLAACLAMMIRHDADNR
jgi:putative dimethyl sulfoxide reductase chaperone